MNGDAFSIVDPCFFLGLFILVSLTTELAINFLQGFHRPINAVSRIIGMIFGLIIFWGALCVAYSLIGGSEIQVIILTIVEILFSVMGMFLRISMAQNDDYSFYR
jgi:uncharacterized protein YacL